MDNKPTRDDWLEIELNSGWFCVNGCVFASWGPNWSAFIWYSLNITLVASGSGGGWWIGHTIFTQITHFE